jgi:hypothetical protein
MNNKNLSSIIIGIVFVFLLFNWLTKSDSKEVETVERIVERVVTPTPSDNYTKLRVDYMEGCNPDGKNLLFCSCTYDELIKIYTYDEIMYISEMVDKGYNIDEYVMPVISECINYI